jgi:hypothetical protein
MAIVRDTQVYGYRWEMEYWERIVIFTLQFPIGDNKLVCLLRGSIRKFPD